MSDGIRIQVKGDPTPAEIEIISLAVRKLLDDETEERRSTEKLSDWQLAAPGLHGALVDRWSGDCPDGSHWQGKGEGGSG